MIDLRYVFQSSWERSVRVEPFKIQYFRTAHRGVPFPCCRALEASEAEHFTNRMRLLLHLPDQADGLAIVRGLAARETLYPGADAVSENFDLRAVCSAVQIEPGSQVFVNWYRFDIIDELAFDDLALYFDDIWYPSSDDIDLFDQTLSWVLSVSHEGQVSTTKFNTLL